MFHVAGNVYSFVVYLYVTGSGSISSVGEERANLSAVVMWFLFWGFPLPIGAWDGLRYFIVALPMSVICHPQILRFPEVLVKTKEAVPSQNY